ncbi:MAG: LysR substrate-binding domain-containing protein [Steroidobacteraceae bacterium]
MSRDLNDTLVFVKVVEHGSFVAAARALRLPKTTVSRKVQELEARLGAQLMHRTTRKLGLTEAGNIYYEHSQHIARVLDEAESAVGQLQSGPRGWLRLTTSYSFGVEWVAPLLGEFYLRYPEVRVEMELTDEPLDLIDKEIDMALRFGRIADPGLVARRLASFRTQVYASPIYLAQHGEPQHPDVLTRHRTFAMRKYNHNGNNFIWPLNDGKGLVDYRIDPVFVTNDPGALRGALLAGEGLMLTADIMMKREAAQGRVQRVLAGWEGPTIDLHAVFPRGQGKSPKVRAFVDYLIERLNFDMEYMAELCPHGNCAEACADTAVTAADAA